MKKEKVKKKREKVVHICPRCGSLDLLPAGTLEPQILSEWVSRNNKQFEGIPDNVDCFLCKDCDFLNICPTVKLSKIRKFQQDLKLKGNKWESGSVAREKITSFQIFASIFLLVFIVLTFAMMSTPYLEAYLLISLPITLIIFLGWIAYRIFKK